MGSLFDVPPELILVLSLAAADPATGSAATDPSRAFSAVASADYRLPEQAWLAAVDDGAGGEDLASYRDAIFKTSSGRYYVPAAAKREQLTSLRRDPRVAAAVAFDLAQSNAAALERRLGHRVSAGDLYVAQVLGLDVAAGLIAAAETTPARPAAEAVAALDRETPLARTQEARLKVGQLYRRLTEGFATYVPPPRFAGVAAPEVKVSAVSEAIPSSTKQWSAFLPPSALRGPAMDDTSGWSAVENVTHVGWLTNVGD